MSASYDALLREAERADLSRVSSYDECVPLGHDSQNNPVIGFVPTLNSLYSHDQFDQGIRLMYLMFVKTAHPIVTRGPFSLAYSDRNNKWGKPIIFDYYAILPESAKRNLVALYIINPTPGARLQHTYIKLFKSRDFNQKLVFPPSIADFQKLISPTRMLLPYHFLYYDDIERGYSSSGVCVPLHVDYLHKVRTTSVVHACTTFLRSSGGLKRVGLFRVAGNDNQLSLVKTRLQPPPSSSKDLMAAYRAHVIVGADGSDICAVGDTDKAAKDFDCLKAMSTVVLTDIDSVAQVTRY